jgi:LPXTG-motif cell wall-anchored protein
MHFLRNLWLGFALLAAAAAAHATPITYTETFTASGIFLGNPILEVPFNTTFTFTGTGDTSAITYGSDPYLILSSATVSTDLHFFGGTETITDPIEVIVVPGFLAGFEDLNTHGLVSTQDGPDLATYDLSGPVTAQGYPYLSTGATFLTTGGELTFSTYSSLSSTFSAVTSSTTASPEPSTLTLVGTLLLGLAGMVARRKRRSPGAAK